MAYSVSQAPTGGTQVNQYAGRNTDAANQFMQNWDAQNPTGYSTNRDFMVADSGAYWAHQARRQSAYDDWLKTQSQPQQQTATNTGAAMPIIQSAMTTPGSVNQISQAQTQGYPINTQQVAQPIISATSAQPQTMAAPGSTATRPASTGGIINQQLGNVVDANGQITGVQAYNAAQLGDPTQRRVTSDQTMQGQLGGILAEDGTLMQMAEARALEQMNERGLANSSLAIGAGQRAVAEVAMPIAQNDAGVYERADTYNVDAKNQFAIKNTDYQNRALEFGAAESNAAGRTNAQNLTQTNISREQNQTQLQIGRERNDTTRWTAQLDADTRMDLGRMDSDTRRYIADQDVGVRRELGYLDASVRREDIGMRRELGMADVDVRRELGHLDADVRREGYATQRELGYLDASVRREGFSTQRELGYLDANTRTNIANMSNATQIAVSEMGYQYQQVLQANELASRQFQQMSQNIASIDMSNLDVQSKQYAIDRQMMQTRDILNITGDISNIPNLGYYYAGGYT